MECDRVVRELDAYLAGELEPEVATAVARHLQTCPECAAECHRLGKENDLYASLRTLVMPASGVWEQIQKRLDLPLAVSSPVARPFLRWVWVAACGVILAAVVYFTLGSYLWKPVPERSAVEARVYLEQAIQHMERAEALLKRAYAAQRSRLNPEVTRELDRNLRIIDQAIVVCRRILRENPHDRRAAEFLMLAYEKKISLLQQILED